MAVGYFHWLFFYFHLFLFIGINSLLIVANLLHAPDYYWFVIPLTCWGLFLFIHFLINFSLFSSSAKDWRLGKYQPLTPKPFGLEFTAQELARQAMTRLFCWMAFYFHLALYGGASLIMFAINYFTFKKTWWSLVAICAWGIWLLVHWLVTYVAFGRTLEAWRLKTIQRFVYLKLLKKPVKQIYQDGLIFFGIWLGFWAHFILFVLSNVVIIASDYWLNPTPYRWFYYPLISWGVLLLGHALLSYLIISPRWVSWREEQLARQQLS